VDPLAGASEAIRVDDREIGESCGPFNDGVDRSQVAVP
jgi:hypothetical protein